MVGREFGALCEAFHIWRKFFSLCRLPESAPPLSGIRVLREVPLSALEDMPPTQELFVPRTRPAKSVRFRRDLADRHGIGEGRQSTRPSRSHGKPNGRYRRSVLWRARCWPCRWRWRAIRSGGCDGTLLAERGAGSV